MRRDFFPSTFPPEFLQNQKKAYICAPKPENNGWRSLQNGPFV